MIVGVDIGNTAIKIAREDDPINVVSVRLDQSDWLTSCRQTILNSGPQPNVRIASVNRAAATKLGKSLRCDAGMKSVQLLTCEDIPITVDTEDPQRVGIDRLVGAYGACQLADGPLVIVDAGTTVTVDHVDADWVYRGGAILPGLEMQTTALSSGTDALPHLDWSENRCTSNQQAGEADRIPGRNTLDAIRLGILSAVVGGIERLVNLYDPTSTLVITGGDAQCIHNALKSATPVIIEPHLVCRTLLNL